MRGISGVIVVLLLFAGTAQARPAVVMFHAGGFLFGSPASLRGAVAQAERRGARAINVRYPLGNPAEAMRLATRIARRFPERRFVYAYGESAGGALAARLAQRGLVDAASTYSPLVNLDAWLDGFWSRYRFVQVKGRRARRPILALAARRDDPRYVRSIRRWARSDPLVALRNVRGSHLGKTIGSPPGPIYGRNMRRSIRWLLDKRWRRVLRRARP